MLICQFLKPCRQKLESIRLNQFENEGHGYNSSKYEMKYM